MSAGAARTRASSRAFKRPLIEPTRESGDDLGLTPGQHPEVLLGAVFVVLDRRRSVRNQDAVNLAEFLTRTTVEAQTFVAGLRGCGGAVNVTTITRVGGCGHPSPSAILPGQGRIASHVILNLGALLYGRRQ